MRKWMWLVSIVLFFVLILLVFIPPGLKWYIEENDQKLIGRELSIDDIDLNPFSGQLAFKKLTMYEANGQDTFLTADTFSSQIAWTKLFQDKIHLKEALVQLRKLNVRQQGKSFNFDDLLSLLEGDSTTSVSSTNNYRWQVDTLNLQIEEMVYADLHVGSQWLLDSLTVVAAELSDNKTKIPVDVSFRSGEAGDWSNQVVIDLRQETYALNTNISDWALQPLAPYLTPHINLKDFDSRLSALFTVVGSYRQTDSIALAGTFRLHDFYMTDQQEDSLLAWSDLSIAIDSANTASQHYNFGNIKLEKPYLLFELSSEGDNFSQALALSQADSIVQQELRDSTEFTSPFEYLALYLYDLTHAYLSTSYVADTILISQGSLDYTDKTLSEPFRMQLTDLRALATDIKAQDEYADFDISSKVNSSGDLSGDLQISRNGISNMNLGIEIQNLSVNDLNSYTTHYMGHPFQSGEMFFISRNSIKDYYLDSENNLFVGEIEIGDKTNKDAEYKVPMKLAVALMRDTKGNVDLDIPVNGNLSDPDYYLGRIILKVLVNVLVKAATSPYRLMANLVGGEEEDFKRIEFEPTSYQLEKKQEQKLNYVAKILEQKPEIKIYLEYNAQNPKAEDLIALAEVKQDYWFSQGIASQDSSWLVQTDLSTSDSLFIQYLENKAPALDSVTKDNLVASCRALVDEAAIDSIQAQLWVRRKNAVADFFSQEASITNDRWEMVPIRRDSLVVDTTASVSYQLKYQLQ